MKLRLQILFLFLGFTSGFASSMHPIKMSTALVEYDETKKEISLVCNVFIDDFLLSIKKTIGKNINLDKPTEVDKVAIAKYFNTFLKLAINKNKLGMKFAASNVNYDANVFEIKFKTDKVIIKKGSQLQIDNTLFYKEFTYLQSNLMLLQFPPFLIEHNIELVYKKSTYTHTF